MKALLITATSLLTIACQPQAHPQAAQEAASRPALVVGRAAATTPAKATASVSEVAPLETLPPALQALVRKHDLTPLLQTVKGDEDHSQNGFFGPEHRRIDFVFTHVQRDITNPNVYHLQGQDRYKGVVTPFEGTFTVSHFGQAPRFSAERLARYRKYSAAQKDPPLVNLTEGGFALYEDSTRRGAGVFRGKVSIAWRVDNERGLEFDYQTEVMSSEGGGLKYEGTWTNSKTHRSYPVVWVEDIYFYNSRQNVLADFNVGERSPEVNPKYARLGWNKYWENEEWWAKTPRRDTGLL
ncbi:hypothetical protein GCM10022409_41400 [Hymenobacter glaciei]|uniref:Outer membrane lipoprotein-sorting protein n=1 Tax=Hymenobacter glaciei TaxID=877209 RepID=A0ABP7UQU4_9BACT